MRTSNRQPRGLILLVVLSMLSLFSMLAISYVIFSGQSRSANFGMARRDYHGMQPSQVLDQAMKQALRGSANSISSIGPHDMLGDLYGYTESHAANLNNLLYQARISAGTDQAEFFGTGDRFLRIPLFLGAFAPVRGGANIVSTVPAGHDLLTGHVLTFLEGPLTGISFRIVRSLGALSTGTPAIDDHHHSVVIDLDEASDRITNLSSFSAVGLCVNTSVTPNRGNQMWINARELNGLGYGIPFNFDGATVTETLTPSPSGIALNLQPGMQPGLLPTFAGGGQVAAAANATLIGDSDESYDAPDFNDFWLAHSRTPSSGTLASTDINPSFHRAALVNYIVNRQDMSNTTSFTEANFIALLNDIQGACGRPLGISVRGLESHAPYSSANAFFDGGNTGSTSAIPALSLNLGGSWANWTSGSPSPFAEFMSWLRFLSSGPWDVDNNGDGLNDSVWVDIDLPLITSSDGKLLKMMCAYYIEDLDSRLDVNAVGNLAQSTSAAYTASTGTNPSYLLTNSNLPQGAGVGPADTSMRHFFASDMDYQTVLRSRYGGNIGSPGSGSGFVAIDDLRSQLRGGSNVFVTSYLTTTYNTLVNSGASGYRQIFGHDRLPALPRAVRGDYAIGLDRLGNPLLLRGANPWLTGTNYVMGTSVTNLGSTWTCRQAHTASSTDQPGVGASWTTYWLQVPTDEGTDDPYEARLISTPHQDAPFGFGEWERNFRLEDWDRSMLPQRLEDFGPISSNSRMFTPRSSATRHVPLGTTSASGQVRSLFDLVNAIGQYRQPTAFTVTPAAFNELFPLEFNRGLAMDLNRPLGNGMDDDFDGMIDEPEEMLKNGADDNANSSVDEPAELTMFLNSGSGWTLNMAQRQKSLYASGSQIARSAVSEFPTFNLANFEFNGYSAGRIDPDYESVVNTGISGSAPARAIADRYHGIQSRQLMARHLYCLGMLLLPDDLFLSNLPPGTALTGPARARAIAQWAVNIVDFRDADQTMTRFAYDPDPFAIGGSTTETTNGLFWYPNRDDADSPNGEVVWGMEQPELLLTETGAFHDLRIRDTSEDDAGTPNKVDAMTNPDNDYDQYRIPQGSLFLELMCPRTTSTTTDIFVPGVGGLYTASGGNVLLNVGAVSQSDGVTAYPVWRVALSTPRALSVGDTTTPTENNIVNGTADSGGIVLPHDVSYQLPTTPAEAALNGLIYDRPTTAGRTEIPAPVIDRIVWFTNPASIADITTAAVGLPTSIAAADIPAHVYFNESTTNPLLNGGQYLVVGPRQETYFGSKTSSATSNANEPNNLRIVLEDSAVTSSSVPAPFAAWANFYTSDNTLVAKRPAAMRDIVPMIAVTTPPWASSGVPNQPPSIGLNVSEPHPTSAGYYPAPLHQVNSTDTAGDATIGAPGFASIPKDSYYDYGAPPPADRLADAPFDNSPGTPIRDIYEPNHPETGSVAGVATPGTQLDWCTAYLQRLADPERPYHATFNPYITVDWMPVDLTVFSGEDTVYTDAMKTTEFTATYQFGFRSKNGAIGTNRGRTFLSYLNDAPTDSGMTGVGGAFFDREFAVDNVTGAIATHTPVPRPTPNTSNFATLGYLNSEYELLNDPTVTIPGLVGTQTFKGVPLNAPANLMWFNRDFATPYELMYVPLSSPGQLMQEFSVPLTNADLIVDDLYADPMRGNIFRHLPNFFQEAQNPTSRTVRQAFTPAVLLEMVTTPSPWSDAEKIVPPGNVNLASLTAPTNTRTAVAIGPLLPPYNRISQMREPGKVNINTLRDEAVWQGIEWNYMNASSRGSSATTLAFANLIASRHTYFATATEKILPPLNPNLNGEYPTEFPGIFKSPLAVGRVPSTRMSVLDQFSTISPAKATLLRQEPTGATPLPLFQARSDIATGVPNPYDQYLPITRLPNLVTSRSNVFAVRVTVGYFEFDPASGIGPEFGWDDGQAKRHRGFYVIDRSIPVAYEPGQDLNTENCVLVRRIIE